MEPMNCGSSLQQGISLVAEPHQLPPPALDASKNIPSISVQGMPPPDTEVNKRRVSVLNPDDFDSYRKEVIKELDNSEKVDVYHVNNVEFEDVDTYTFRLAKRGKEILSDAGIEQSKLDGLIFSGNKPFIFDREINTALLNELDRFATNTLLFIAQPNQVGFPEQEIRIDELRTTNIPMPAYAERYLGAHIDSCPADYAPARSTVTPTINTELYANDRMSCLFTSHINQVNETLFRSDMSETAALAHIRSIYADPISHVEGQLFTTMKSASDIEREQLDEARLQLEKVRMDFNELTAELETKKQELPLVSEDLRSKKEELVKTRNELDESSRKLEENSKKVKDSEKNLCTVCLEDDCERNVVFMPCRHLLCCNTCSQELTDCPICRTKISEKISVFYP